MLGTVYGRSVLDSFFVDRRGSVRDNADSHDKKRSRDALRFRTGSWPVNIQRSCSCGRYVGTRGAELESLSDSLGMVWCWLALPAASAVRFADVLMHGKATNAIAQKPYTASAKSPQKTGPSRQKQEWQAKGGTVAERRLSTEFGPAGSA